MKGLQVRVVAFLISAIILGDVLGNPLGGTSDANECPTIFLEWLTPTPCLIPAITVKS